jgi:hypothetical protein
VVSGGRECLCWWGEQIVLGEGERHGLSIDKVKGQRMTRGMVQTRRQSREETNARQAKAKQTNNVS